MNIYRVLRLGALNDLSAGTVLEAIVVAPDEGWARGVAVVEENDQAVAHHWLDVNKTRCQEIGLLHGEVAADRVDGADAPYALMVNRKHSLHGQS